MWEKLIVMMVVVMVMMMVVVTMKDDGSITSSDVHFLRDGVIVRDDEEEKKGVEIINTIARPLPPKEVWKTEEKDKVMNMGVEENEEERRSETGNRNTIEKEEEEDKLINMGEEDKKNEEDRRPEKSKDRRNTIEEEEEDKLINMGEEEKKNEEERRSLNCKDRRRNTTEEDKLINIEDKMKNEEDRRSLNGKDRRRRNTIEEEEEDKMKNMIAGPEVEIFIPQEHWKLEKEKENGSTRVKDWNAIEEKRWLEEGEEEERRGHKGRKQRRRRRRKWRNKKGRKFYRRNRTYGVKKKSKHGAHVSRYRLRNSPNQRPPWMAVQSYRSLDPRRIKVRRHLVRQHNLLRAKVEPPAGDMLAMKWYKTAAEQAQSWAEQCEHHSDPEHPSVRWTSSYGACGQNVFLSPTKKRWSEVLQHWWDSNRYFDYDGTNNNNTVVAAYTQMAWYNSHQLGCGFSQCHTTGGTTFFRYVCNYCPTGNDPTRLSRPYTIGSSCSLCPGSCRSLCPRRRCPLCTNACTYSDLWVNCRTLDQEWHEWLCNTKTTQGVERFKNCRATCQCVNEIT